MCACQTPSQGYPPHFTEQSSDGYINLLWYNSRHYDPELGRFIQPDSIVPLASQGTQAWDRYAYVNNSPINYIDPSGHMCSDPDDPTPSCDGSGNYPSNNTPLGSSNVYVPPASLDFGQEQEHSNSSSYGNESNQNCSWGGAFGGQGCDLHYLSLGLGLDAPTLMMLSGLGISSFAPQVGVPLGLAGAAFEACYFTATPLCAMVKLASVNAAITLDKDGNFYIGPQLSWGKSILPFGAISFNGGIYPTKDGHIPTEAEMEDSLSGLSFSAGSIATGGISYSPNAINNQVAYYFVGVPEIFSVNVFQYNVLFYDFSP